MNKFANDNSNGHNDIHPVPHEVLEFRINGDYVQGLEEFDYSADENLSITSDSEVYQLLAENHICGIFQRIVWC